jgi:selenocysteine lyase/cysteine desulfurase
MGTQNIRKREEELVDICFEKMVNIPKLHILAENVKERLGIVSFYFETIHYNMVVKLLSDRFGIQMRGGCACAGTYGHFLLDVTHEQSRHITEMINSGDLSLKPGWVRLSLHPTMTNDELLYIIDAIAQIAENHIEWSKDYIYNKHTNEFTHINRPNSFYNSILEDWFTV